MKKDTSFLQSRYLNPTLVAIGALVLSIIIAYVTDIFLGLMVKQAQSTFRPLPAYWFRAAIPLIQAAMMIALAWALLIKLPPSRATAIIYLASGSLVIGTYLTTFIGFPFGHTIVGQFRNAIGIWGGTHSSLYHLAAFWIFVGIAGLMRRSNKAETNPDEKQRKTTE